MKRWLQDMRAALGTPAYRPRLLETSWRLSSIVDEIVAALGEDEAFELRIQIREARDLIQRTEDELELLASLVPAEAFA